VLRTISGPKTEKVVRGPRKLHSEELHNLHGSPYANRAIKSRTRWAGHVVRIGEVRNAYEVMVGKPERKKLFRIPRRTSEDNIRMDPREEPAYLRL
jgi:hypothetical protein